MIEYRFSCRMVIKAQNFVVGRVDEFEMCCEKAAHRDN